MATVPDKDRYQQDVSKAFLARLFHEYGLHKFEKIAKLKIRVNSDKVIYFFTLSLLKQKMLEKFLEIAKRYKGNIRIYPETQMVLELSFDANTVNPMHNMVK